MGPSPWKPASIRCFSRPPEDTFGIWRRYLVWESTTASDLARGDGLTALAVAGDAVLAGLEVTNKDRYKERQQMPFRLQVINLADGKLRQDLALKAKPIEGGITVADGRVFAVTSDGTLACFAAEPR